MYKILGLKVEPINPFTSDILQWVADKNVSMYNSITFYKNEIDINVPLCCVPHNIGGKIITIKKDLVSEKLIAKIADVLKEYPNCDSYHPRLLKNEKFESDVNYIIGLLEVELGNIQYEIDTN